VTKQERKVFITLWEEGVNFLIETGGCDHSVGICYCGLVGAVEEGFDILRKRLKELESTPRKSTKYSDAEAEHTELAFLVSEAQHSLKKQSPRWMHTEEGRGK
jgi:hypothetical protein